MTQIKDMTDQQLKRALTELQGYSVKISSVSPRWYSMINPQGREFGVIQMSEDLAWNEYAFPYCTDPAASLEVEKVAIEHDFDAYVQNLAIVKWGEPDEDVEDTAVWNKTMRYSIAELLTASPRERAEAAYITLQGAVNT